MRAEPEKPKLYDNLRRNGWGRSAPAQFRSGDSKAAHFG